MSFKVFGLFVIIIGERGLEFYISDSLKIKENYLV